MRSERWRARSGKTGYRSVRLWIFYRRVNDAKYFGYWIANLTLISKSSPLVCSGSPASIAATWSLFLYSVLASTQKWLKAVFCSRLQGGWVYDWVPSSTCPCFVYLDFTSDRFTIYVFHLKCGDRVSADSSQISMTTIYTSMGFRLHWCYRAWGIQSKLWFIFRRDRLYICIDTRKVFSVKMQGQCRRPGFKSSDAERILAWDLVGIVVFICFGVDHSLILLTMAGKTKK